MKNLSAQRFSGEIKVLHLDIMINSFDLCLFVQFLTLGLGCIPLFNKLLNYRDIDNENLLVCLQFLSGGQSEVEATLNLNAMNQSPNPWHVSFSYARALQNTVLKTWQGNPENVEAAQKALLVRAKANSLAQLGKYSADGESDEAKRGMFVKGYTY